jgi:dolichyl-phosphate-mannose--protein O-mannosyl transferase
MSLPPAHPRDPVGWTAFLTLLFAGLCAVRLTIPSQPFFDEVHYLPPARAILALSHPLNPEHPPLGKELIALGIALFGDNPLGWRIMPMLAGVLALLSFMRALWHATCSRFASLSGGVLLVLAFPIFVQARIAMLDIFMAAFTLLALWMCAGACREQETARWRLAIAGAALGCAMAAKWNAIPLAMLPGLGFLVVRLRTVGWQALTARRSAPIAGMTLPEAALWLGMLPLATYALCYWPNFLYARDAIEPGGLIELHRRMLALQQQPLASHTYQSRWWQWVIDWRAIWYLYEPIDGAQRGVLLVGNPLVMLAGLPALVWCAWAGLRQRQLAELAVAVLYAVSLGLWIIAAKNVQFYYHYLLPSCFLVAALALALDRLWQRGQRILPLAVLAGSAALFVFFWPILTAAPLDGPKAFERWTWLDSWR